MGRVAGICGAAIIFGRRDLANRVGGIGILPKSAGILSRIDVFVSKAITKVGDALIGWV